jgi:hypothetical protein
VSHTWADLRPAWHAVGPTWAGIFDTFVYTPTVRCFIGGVNVTGLLDGSISVRRGRDTVYQPTAAAYTSFDFVDLEDVPVQVGQTVRVTIEDFLGNQRPVFRGAITDFERLLNVATADPKVTVRVQALGPLSTLNRRNIFADGRVAENDGERVAASILDALSIAWEQIDPATKWEDIDPTLSWEEFDGVALDLVDDGLFDLTAVPASDAGYSPLDLIQQASFSAEGILFETPDGRLGYANAARRAANLLNRIVDIPLSATVQQQLAVSSELADLVNRAIVTYGDDDAVVRSDAQSIVDFGEFALRLDTILADQANAETFGDDYVARHKQPRLRLQRIGIAIESVDGLLLQDLVTLGTCGCTDAVRITALPPQLGVTEFVGFVEGIEWRLTRSSVDLNLLVSDKDLSVTPSP